MIVLDVETTGLDPIASSIVSIGAVNFSAPDEQFYGECSVFEGATVEPAALELNGFTERDVTDRSKPSDGELVGRFKVWLDGIGDYTFGGLNHHFDLLFLMESAKRGGVSIGLERGSDVLPKRIVDLHSVCYATMQIRGREVPTTDSGFSGLSSYQIYDYVGIPAEPHPHNALNGATWEAEALSRLLYGRALLDEFQTYPVLWVEEAA